MDFRKGKGETLSVFPSAAAENVLFLQAHEWRIKIKNRQMGKIDSYLYVLLRLLQNKPNQRNTFPWKSVSLHLKERWCVFIDSIRVPLTEACMIVRSIYHPIGVRWGGGPPFNRSDHLFAHAHAHARTCTCKCESIAA